MFRFEKGQRAQVSSNAKGIKVGELVTVYKYGGALAVVQVTSVSNYPGWPTILGIIVMSVNERRRMRTL